MVMLWLYLLFTITFSILVVDVYENRNIHETLLNSTDATITANQDKREKKGRKKNVNYFATIVNTCLLLSTQ